MPVKGTPLDHTEGTLEFLARAQLGTGTCQWGDRGAWGYGVDYGEAEVRAAFTASLEAGIELFDTAELYGWGRSERLLGTLLRSANRPVRVATKFLPLPWRLDKGSLRRALRASLRRLGLPRLDLYQIHWPLPPRSTDTWLAALCDALDDDLIEAVGVSNFDFAQTRRAVEVLGRRGRRLASNQVHYNLLQRAPEQSGLASYCRDQGIRLIAYSPLERGILSGKYSATRLPAGRRFGPYRSPATLAALEPLLTAMRRIGEERGGRSPSQVAINWIVCKGALPIPGAKSARQLADNAGAIGWRLTPTELTELDTLTTNLRP